MPDSEMILGICEENTRKNLFDYETEFTKVPYISGVIEDPDNSGEKLIYRAVPVERDGKTEGILYGFVNLKDFANSITATAFDGNTQIYVADGETGDFLVDTWHDTLGNVFDEDISSRKVKPGYDYQEMKENFVKGKAGHIAFWSNTAGEYFYSYYKAVGVNHWMIQITVPESIAFENAIIAIQ